MKKAKFYFLSLTASLSLHAHAAVLYVDLNSSSPSTPYASWATAATNIQDAIDAASPGDQVLVTNGVYQTGGHVVYGALTNRVAVTKPLTLQSINGPAVTVIQGYQVPGTTNDNGAIRCVYLTNDAVLVGFTLTNGATLWNQSEASDYGVFIGGGVFCESASAIVSNCVITHCSASDTGGGAAGGILNNCILAGNFGGIGGGTGGGAGGAVLNNCKIFDNSTTQNGGGGGVGYCTANNCLIYHNSAGAGGGAYSSTLNNCTLFENSAYNGGGSYNGGFQSDSPLNNCILYGNTASNSGDNYAGFYGVVLNYCCTTPLPADGAGNFTNAPLFVNPAGGDFHLQTNSPCLNAGNNALVNATNDLDGIPRIQGLVVDVGAYEFPIAVALGADYTNVAAGFTVNFTSQVFAGNVSGSTFDFGDGTVVSNQLSGAHAWVAPGDYAVTLRVFSDIYPAGISAAVTVHVFAGNYFVSLASSSPVPPYTSWATAATNIQDAVDAAVAGGTVLVTNGVYNVGGRVVFGAMTNRVAVNKPVTVASVNGPSVTAIEGFSTNDNVSNIRCIYLTNNAALIGFTLTNGATIQGGDYVREWSGAGAWCEPSGVVVSNCVFINNTAQGDGGGAYGGTLVNCSFTNNYGYDGGAAFSCSLKRCTLLNNRSYYGGGACNSSLTGCTLTGNFTYVDSDYTANGGGASGCSLTNCVLAQNRSNNGGGASGCTLVNCVLSGNFSDGVYFAGGGGASSSTLINCTVVGNTCVNAGGGGVVSSTLTNCIVYFNKAQSGTNYTDDSTFYFCDTSPMPTNGANNIASDPLFADSLHISSTSPCRGAGLFSATSGVDIDGDAWLNPPSIGADEFNSASATGALAVAISETFSNVTTGFTIDFAAQVSGHATANIWNFGDGTTVSNELFVAHSWNAPGNYTVTFTAFNTSNPAGVSSSVTLFVLQNPVHYVAQNNPTPAAPFLTWATAATNIHDAVDAAFAGGTIIVSNGIYQTGVRILYGSMTNRVAVTKPLTLQSVNGAAATVIDGGNAIRCLYLTNHVSVTGFALRNGTEINGAGVFCQGDDTLSDCILTGNFSPADWSFGGGANGGTFYRCTFAGNQASYYGSGAANATLVSCLLSNNLPTAYGGGAAACTLSNCVVVGNSASWGGGLDVCTANNCLITGNSAQNEGGGAMFSSFLNNCTVISNTAAGGGGIDYSTAKNCILYFNSGGNFGGQVALDYCCTMPEAGGSLNITNAPLFVNMAGGDFHLQTNSPCINSGNNAFVVGTNDLDGLARVSGGTVDIGAHEFQNPGSIISFAWLQQYSLPTDGSADNLDSDNDGFKNWQEWRAGTSPTDAASLLRMLAPAHTNNASGVTVIWQSVSGINYFIQRGGNLSAPFSVVESNIVGQAGTTSFTDTTATNPVSYFYRVGVP